jgi:hypothetical protein
VTLKLPTVDEDHRSVVLTFAADEVVEESDHVLLDEVSLPDV